ncbi:MAG: ABC transporter transmembrane domain-containing protein, partial [Candidatus Scatosoma sp.]
MAEMKGRMRGMAMQKGAIKKGTFARLIKYVFKYYKWQLVLVAVCLLISAGGGLISSLFMQKNIDDIMNPGIVNGYESVAGKLAAFIAVMGACYLLALLATFTYNRVMATVTQGTLYHVRKDMFNKMEKLPIKYFDTHAHGEIMSSYTNDTDALRQLVGQSLPTLISSSLTLAVAVFLMLWYS